MKEWERDDELIGQDRVQEPIIYTSTLYQYHYPYTYTFTYSHVLVYGPHEGLVKECTQAISRTRPDPSGGDGYIDATPDIIRQDRCFQFVPLLYIGYPC
jgi:hypothetical protein